MKQRIMYSKALSGRWSVGKSRYISSSNRYLCMQFPSDASDIWDKFTVSYLQPHTVQNFHLPNHADAIYIQCRDSLIIDAQLTTVQITRSDKTIKRSSSICYNHGSEPQTEDQPQTTAQSESFG